MDRLDRFYFGEFEFHLRAVTELLLPQYKGSTFRGSLGHALRKLSCQCEKIQNQCDKSQHNCAYSYLMATSVFHSSLTLAQNPPHPMILEPPLEEKQSYPAGEEIIFKMILIGRAINYLTYLLLSVQRMGEVGIGKSQGKFHLEQIEALFRDKKEVIYSSSEPLLSLDILRTTWADIIDQSLSLGDVEDVTFNFLTPVRLKHSRLLLKQDILEFSILFNNLLTRISRLSRYYCRGINRLNFQSLSDAAKEIKTADIYLRWHDWERYSSRQQTKMKLGGLIGSIRFVGGLTPFLPYLLLGRFIHIGKNTIFGLGKYELMINR